MIRYAIDSHAGKLPPDMRMTVCEGSPISAPLVVVSQPLSEDAIHAMEVALEAARAAWADYQQRHAA